MPLGRSIFSQIYALARPYGRRRLARVFAFSLAQGIFQVVGVTSIFPFLAVAADPGIVRHSKWGARILDALPEMSDRTLLLWAGAFALLMLLASNLINLGAEINRTTYSRGFAHWLRMGLLRKMVSRPYRYFLQHNTGILLKKINGDVVRYTGSVLMPLLDGSARLITCLMLIATLIFVDPWAMLVATVVLSAFYWGVFAFLRPKREAIREGSKSTQRGIMKKSQQLLGGIKPTKVHRAEHGFLTEIETDSKLQADLMAWMPLYQNGPRYLVEPLAFGGMVVLVLVYVVTGQEIAEILPKLGVMALAGYRLLPAAQMLYSQVTGISSSLDALEEVSEEFAMAEDELVDREVRGHQFTTPAPLHWTREIRLADLTFQYPGTVQPVIQKLNLSIPKNSSLGIIGTTGSGKSTLVDLILGLHQPSSGEILVDGTPLTYENRRAWRGGIGYVPQDIFLLDDTLAANIAFGVPEKEIDPERLREAAAAAQILEFIESLPQQWQSKVGERGVRLSGGQRQRVGLARALYHRPELLILDEATSALDIHTEAEVMKAINALHGTLTLLIIAHRLSTTEQCERVLDLSPRQLEHSAV